MPSFCIANHSKKGVGRWLAAAFCLAVLLCAAPIAGAEAEVVQAEGAHAEKVQVQGSESTGAACAPVPKKKIALAQFDVANTQHVDDINNIYDGLPQVLSSRLEASGEFLPVYTARSVPAEAGAAQREAALRIAEEAGAQFLISGVVVNAGVTRQKGFWGTTVVRHIEVEFAIYDGLTGVRLLTRRLGEHAEGDEVMVGNDKPFGSSIFFETESGKALNRLIDLAVRDIRAALANVPFSAHIIRVEEKKVFLDAGSASLLRPGDRLVAYAGEAGIPVVGLEGSALGVMNHAADIITLTTVQPRFSVGELSEAAAQPRIKAGNVAKIDPVEQHNLLAKQMAAQQAAKEQQEAKAEAERVKAEQAARAEAARLKAEQDAKAEAARIKEEKKAAAQAKAKAAAEAKAAKLKAQREARAARVKAAREARARELAREKARAAAEAKAAKLKAQREAKAEAARIKTEKKAQAKAAAEAAARQAAASGVAETKTGAVAAAQQATASGVAQTSTGAEAAPAQKKPGVPLKLKQIKP